MAWFTIFHFFKFIPLSKVIKLSYSVLPLFGGDDMSYSNSFALIVVLFILLIIVGSAFVKY
ncbi:hypothetical protein BTA31_00955 [Bacillus haynesii]|uniref:Sporulation protein YjcZ n=4 Tax=Bacillus TaxID=1386 RepID=A0ABX3I901_9BACI|nr:hypothetical protein BTA31_00955 [Bacillus haynesii]